MRRSLSQVAAAELGFELPDAKTPAKTPFGFLEDVRQLQDDWSVFRQKGILAYGGGWRDQPAEWRDGILTLNAMYAEEYDALRRRMPR